MKNLNLRMIGWLIASIVLLMLDMHLSSGTVQMSPNPMHLIIHKLNMITWGAWVGYLIFWRLNPYARPHEMMDAGYYEVGIKLIQARVWLIAATILAMAVGL